MTDKLLPCPFCGGESIDTTDFGASTWFVQCDDCGATFPHFDTETEAITAWNRRAQPENDCPAHYDKSGCAMNSGFCIGGECSSYADAGMPENEPLTNAQRIRGMTDEELAVWILRSVDCDKENIMCIPALYKNSDKCDGRCRDGRLSWLQQPAETEGTE